LKIIHIINSLGDGGAEHSLFKICKYDIINKHIVISLTGSGKYGLLLKNLGTKVYCLNANFFSIHKFFYLIKLLRYLKPDIVQTWLVHADLIGGIAARIANIKNIVWNIRYTKLDKKKIKLKTFFILKLLSKLSFLIPKAIIINSKQAFRDFKEEGYEQKKFRYIPNGYDLSILKPSKIQTKNFKKLIKIKKQTPLIGYVARYDPLKDHLNLLNSLSLMRLKNIDFFCVLVGTNINKNKLLINKIKKLKLKNFIKLFGAKKNISNIMNGIDIHVLTSISEGFPNVLAEAMAHGTPCVSTNVGDASVIIGKTGLIVPINDSVKLASKIEKLILEKGTKQWKQRCNLARLRINKNFHINKMIKSYNKLYFNILKNE